MDLSIIVPAHNEENYIQATLEALADAIAEIDCAAEVIVVNDDSTDQTEAIAMAFEATVENVKLRNIGAVRNAGARIANGKWLVFVDADTIVPPDTLVATIKKLRSGAIGGGARVELPDLKELSFLKRGLFHAVVTGWQKMGGWAAGCYMFCSANSFYEIGGFNEEYYAAEEYFFSKSLKRKGKFELVSSPVLTSSRKLRRYSVFQLSRFLIRPMFTRKGIFKSRKGLEILYDDER